MRVPVFAVSVIFVASLLTAQHAASAQTTAQLRPNIVLITTDDQNLTDLDEMPKTRRWIADSGVTFAGISPHPLCCPARAEILTGQFAQNNGVRTNKGRYGARKIDLTNTLPVWLDNAGYNTAFLGKFLNGYDTGVVDAPPPGWDSWQPTAADIYNYTDFTVNDNGALKQYTDSYQTDVFTEMAVTRIREWAPDDAPFFIWQSYVAPHRECLPTEAGSCWGVPPPADRHRGLFADALSPSLAKPSYDEDTSDKPSHLAEKPSYSDREHAEIQDTHRGRLRSLQAVDDGVARTLRALAAQGELSNTLVIFTSDNGFLLGEHRHDGKTLPYEESLRVPLLMRGPGLPSGTTTGLGLTVDIAPTIVAAAMAESTLTMDGMDLHPVSTGEVRSWSTVLIQGGPNNKMEEVAGWFYRGVRTSRYMYAHYPNTDEYELYDRRRDRYQLTNVADKPRYGEVLSELRRRAELLADCSGDCNRKFGPVGSPA